MEQALRRLIDRQEIADLIHDYCIHVDRYEPEKVAALFTEDCITDYGAAFGGAVVGRRRVERGCGYTLAGWQATSHHVSNIRLWFEGDDAARSITYLHAWHEVDEHTPAFQIWGEYHDRFVRTEQGWRISERRFRAVGQENGDNPIEGIGRRTPDPALVAKHRRQPGA